MNRFLKISHTLFFLMIGGSPGFSKARETLDEVSFLDYAMGRKIYVFNQGTQAKSELPGSMYRFFRSNDLSDFRVFTQDEISLAFKIEPMEDSLAIDTTTNFMPFYCSYTDSASQQKVRQQLDQASMEFHWQETGKLSLKVNPLAHNQNVSNARFIHCLIDLEKNPEFLNDHSEILEHKLVLDWEKKIPTKDSNHYSISSSVEFSFSKDLLNWSPGKKNQYLKEFKKGEFYAKTNEINLKESLISRYIKLKIQQEESGFIIKGIKEKKVEKRRFVFKDTMTLRPISKDSTAWYFSTKGPRLIEKVQIQVDKYKWSTMSLSCKNKQDSAFQKSWQGNVFFHHDSTYIDQWKRNKELLISQLNNSNKIQRCTEWKLEPENPKELSSQTPLLKMVYAKEEVKFLTNGENQLVFAWGRHPDLAKAPLLMMPELATRFEKAKYTAKVYELGGDMVLNPPEKIEWSSFLWLSLMAFLGVSIFMVRSLWSEIKLLKDAPQK